MEIILCDARKAKKSIIIFPTIGILKRNHWSKLSLGFLHNTMQWFLALSIGCLVHLHIHCSLAPIMEQRVGMQMDKLAEHTIMI